MEITPELIVTALVSMGFGGIVPMITKGVYGWVTGRQAREREGWLRADVSERARRAWEAWAHRVRLVAIRHGFEHLLPAPPEPFQPDPPDSPTSIIEPPRRDS